MSTGVVHPFNPMKLLLHADKIALMRSGRPTRGPVSLEWDLSNTCGHQCAFCSFGTKESNGYRQQNWQHFPRERALSLVPELADAGVESITFTGGGEPLNHPAAAEIMQRVEAHNMAFGLVTNGQLLRKDAATMVARHAVFVRVSWDAGTAETHQIMHRTPGPQLDEIADNMRGVIQLAKVAQLNGIRTDKLTVGASFCVTDLNYMEIETAALKLAEMGANYLEVRPTFPTTWRGDGWDFSLSNVQAAKDALAKAKEAVSSSSFKVIGMVDRFASLEGYAKGYSTCGIGPLTSVLGAEGTLWHCCVQRGQSAFALVNVLHEPTFAVAWAKAQARKMADQIDVTRCPRCRYDSYNEILEGLDRDGFHAAFV